MTYKKKNKLSKSQKRALEALFEIKYVDGKPVRQKTDPFEELRKELEPEEDANPADAAKRELYGNLPQAHAKRDRSITARDLNMTLESFNRRRFETKFSTITGFENRYTDYIREGWKFRWDKTTGTISTKEKPEGCKDFYYEDKKLIQFLADEPEIADFVYEVLDKHIKSNCK